jgi:hypothetical protein
MLRSEPTNTPNIHSVNQLCMVAPTCFGITLPSSGSVPSAFWEMHNWGAVDRILWMGMLCLVTWCSQYQDMQYVICNPTASKEYFMQKKEKGCRIFLNLRTVKRVGTVYVGISQIPVNTLNLRGYAVAQLVVALYYKPEGRRFNSRWCHCNFSLT